MKSRNNFSQSNSLNYAIAQSYIKMMREKELNPKVFRFLKKQMYSFVKEYRDKIPLDMDCLNDYLSNTLPKKYPHYSNSVKLKKNIEKTLNSFLKYYLTKINYRKIRENGGISVSTPSFEKHVSTPVKRKNQTHHSTKEYRRLKDRVFNIINRLSIDDKLEYPKEVQEELKEIDENSLVIVLLDLVKEVDNISFSVILFILTDLIRLNTLPSKLLKLLKNNAENPDNYFYRLLMIYQNLMFSGYILQKDFEDVIDELDVDIISYFQFVGNGLSEDTTDHLSNNSFNIQNFSSTKERIMKDIRSLGKNYIDTIKPFSTKNPIVSKNSDIKLYNFPKNMKLNLQRHIKFLKYTFKDPEKFINFINSDLEEFHTYFSTPNSKLLMSQATQDYYDGRYEEALSLLDILQSTGTNHFIIYYLRSKILESQGKTLEALRWLVKSIDKNQFHIELYMDLSYLLLVGGYFHSSIILTTLLLRFSPFDFNFHIQLAISLHQLGYPFKHYLRLLNRIHSSRLLNFLKKYWSQDQFNSKDSLKYLKISEEKFRKYITLSRIITEKSLEIIDDEGILSIIDPEQEINKTKLVLNPFNFFKDKSKLTQKNWFVYDLFNELLDNFDYLIQIRLTTFYEFSYFKKYINFCLKCAKQITNELIMYISSHQGEYPQLSLAENILEKKQIKNNEFFKFFSFFIKKSFIKRVIDKSIKEIINYYIKDDKEFLLYPDKWCINFFETLNLNNLPKDIENTHYLFEFLDISLIKFKFYLKNKGLKISTINEKTKIIIQFLIFLVNQKNIENFKDLRKEFNQPTIIIDFRDYYFLKIQKNITIYNDLKNFELYHPHITPF